jgi:hypothetical protein
MVGQLKDNYRNIRNVMSITLAELASDQRSKYPDIGTDKELHGYFSGFYEDHLTPYRDKPVTLLEIGSAWGGGLVCWDNWFSQAMIHGVELRDHTHNGKLLRQQNDPNFIWYDQEFIPEVFQSSKIKLHAGQDAYTSEFANSLPKFDIIIDDGWHTVDQWETLYQLYLPKILPGGVLIIEDISDTPLHMTPGWTIQNNLIEPIKHYRHQLFDFRAPTNKHDSMILAVWVD